MSAQVLTDTLFRLERRTRLLGWATSAVWAIVAGAATLIAWAWIDLLMDAPIAVRMAGFAAAAAVVVAVFAMQMKRAAKEWREESLVRRLDVVGGAHGQIVAGYDLLRETYQTAGSPSGLTLGLATMASDRAGILAAQAPLADTAPANGLRRGLIALVAIAAAIGLFALLAPNLIRSQFSRMADPYGDHPIYSTVKITVQPGDVQVVYGGDVDIKASVNGGAVDRLETVLVSDASGEEVVPMFAESDGQWRTSLANVTTAAKYYVRTHQTRTSHFAISVLTVPRITGVTARVTPPAYTRQPPLDGPVPAAGVAALADTTIEFKAKSNRPLSGGELEITGDLPGAAVESVTLSPAPGGDPMEVRGVVKVKTAGKVKLRLRDTAGQLSTDAFVTAITLLQDQRPIVRILEPKRQSYATPNARLPVEIMAEDDFGLTAIMLYRSLNDSRALGLDMPIAANAGPRQRSETLLSLAPLGLKPGDVVQLAGRAEDNDPSGAKGSESPPTSVQIISVEDYNRMMVARAGLEMLLSKYQQAQRRLETTEANLRKMKADLGKTAPDSPLSEDFKKNANDTAQSAANDANEVDDAKETVLPFDIDKAMAPRLDDVSKRLRDVANRLTQGTAGAASVKDELALLDELIKGVDDEQKDFDNQVIEPLDFLAKIYPLIADQEKFVQLYLRQDSLAQRLAGIHDATRDDPRDKARMRDMEQEQKQIERALADLLDDIKTLADALPADAEIADFKASAAQFAQDVADSDASDFMSLAEMSLADFWPEKAHAQAVSAAEALKKFIKDGGGGMGGQGQNALAFQPALMKALGNTVAQMLRAAGLGGAGGYSMPGDNSENVGVYGSQPLGQPKRSGNGAIGGGIAGGNLSEPAPGANGSIASQRGKSGGAAAIPVPPQYQRKVNQYFQRVADEIQKE